MTAHPEGVQETCFKVEIGKRLKSLRLHKGSTQKELAAKVRGGLDYTYIGKIERGEQLPSLKILIKISEALSVSVGYFFLGEAVPAVNEMPAAELKLIVKDERGRKLLKALKLLHDDDIPLLFEIVKVLIRHRNVATRKLSDTLGEEALMAAEEEAPYGKK
ncbi:MAG TPA: helix-turn-helix transcriptional regulator [Syntrophales bacterium]|nr:helix-turn-helix transcriptional regulator [Syntrophales bacterium]